MLSYYHEKKQKEAAANGLYYDGHKYYAPINPTGDNPAGTPERCSTLQQPRLPAQPRPVLQ
ncbi:MAG: hypothetical protein U1U88_001047 [Lawsonella clevelandensis]